MRADYGDYDPDGVGVDNGNFLGLPKVRDPDIVFLAAASELTVSYGAGTAGGPANVLAASAQLDVSLPDLHFSHELGVAWRPVDVGGREAIRGARAAAERVIGALEAGDAASAIDVELVDAASRRVDAGVQSAVAEVLTAGAFPVLVGGEHAVSLGAFRACARHHGGFGILQVDAHMDLRPAYEGFGYSHASVMANALELPEVERLVQVGIRDWSPGEFDAMGAENGRVATFFDYYLKRRLFEGDTWRACVTEVVEQLPRRVWVSFDVDGLDPALCAHTGTPVPGGLGFAEAQYLLRAVVDSGREVVGVDVVEVAGAPHEYEGAVAARLAYDLACRAVSSQRPEGGEVGGRRVERE